MKYGRRLVALALFASAAGAIAADAPLKIYAPGELAYARYTVIKRLWVETPRSAFYVRAHADSGDAISELVNEATRIGADGVVNLHCLNGGQFMQDAAAWFCYGNAIKLKQ